jgi:DNA-binding SARP family transcriptional activator
MVSGHAGCVVEKPAANQRATVNLFNGPFVVIDGGRFEVPEGSKRLVAFVSMHHGRLERRYVAGSLWPCVDDIRAAGNLRSALWRLRGAGIDIIDADKWSLRLLDQVDVDLDESSQWAERIIRNTARDDDFDGIADRARALDVLPGCYDDWVIAERERIRQRTLHALEALSRLLAAFGRFGEAVEAAMTAVQAEPLRESAQRALIDAHLGEGNVVEARRSFVLCRQLLNRELGIEPSRCLSDAVRLTRESPRAERSTVTNHVRQRVQLEVLPRPATTASR